MFYQMGVLGRLRVHQQQLQTLLSYSHIWTTGMSHANPLSATLPHCAVQWMRLCEGRSATRHWPMRNTDALAQDDSLKRKQS